MSTVLYYREIQQKERNKYITRMCFLDMNKLLIDWSDYLIG